jgi:hypothetical protein
MILTLLKRALGGVFSSATAERTWAPASSPRTGRDVAAVRRALVEELEAEADAAAAGALGIEEDDVAPEGEAFAHRPTAPSAVDQEPPAPPKPAASERPQKVAEVCPAPAEGDQAFLAWVHGRRKRHQSWAGIALAALAAGHAISDKVLRRRYQDWCASQRAPATVPANFGPCLPALD